MEVYQANHSKLGVSCLERVVSNFWVPQSNLVLFDLVLAMYGKGQFLTFPNRIPDPKFSGREATMVIDGYLGTNTGPILIKTKCEPNDFTSENQFTCIVLGYFLGEFSKD